MIKFVLDIGSWLDGSSRSVVTVVVVALIVCGCHKHHFLRSISGVKSNFHLHYDYIHKGQDGH